MVRVISVLLLHLVRLSATMCNNVTVAFLGRRYVPVWGAYRPAQPQHRPDALHLPRVPHGSARVAFEFVT